MSRSLSYLILLLMTSSATAQVFRMQLERIQRNPSLTSLEKHRERRSVNFSGKTETALLKNETDYTGLISIGTPPQTIRVVFSTGSSSLVLIAPGAYSYQNQGNDLTKAYKSSESVTYKGDLTRSKKIHRYGDGGAGSGYMVTDNITVSGITVTGQWFLEATTFTAPYKIEVGGIVGLACPSQAERGEVPLFRNMLLQNAVQNPIFSFYLNPNTGDKLGGHMTLGGTDEEFFEGPVTYVNVTKKGFWQFRVDSIGVVSGLGLVDNVVLRNIAAVVDTAANLILGPDDEIMKINNAIGAKRRSTYSDIYYLDCDSASGLPDVVLTIGGKKFPLTGFEYLHKNPDGRSCYSAFIADRNFEDWTIGEVFLARYYSIYDFGNDRIGFARSRPWASPSTNDIIV